jgi:hypothetical protein
MLDRMTIVAPLLAVVAVSGVAVLWLAVPIRRRNRARLHVRAVPMPRVASEPAGGVAPPPVTPRPRLPGLTRTRPVPTLGPPKRPSAPRRVPTNAFSDDA